MSTFAGKLQLAFEPKMAVLMDSVAVTATPENMRPSLGPVASLAYKPSRLHYLLRLSAPPTTGAATLILKASDVVVATRTLAITGATVISEAVSIDVSQVSGEAELRIEVDVSSAADSGIFATVDAFISVDQPLIISGC